MLEGSVGPDTYHRKLRHKNDEEGRDVYSEQPRIVMRIMGRCKESLELLSERIRSTSRGRGTYNVMGTIKSHFFAGVYCAPSSICSHKVRLSYTPP